jgi:3-oxoacyl-[acyl-carrier-protein] synthase III
MSPAIVFQQSLAKNGAIGASPTLFAGSVQNSIAAQLSLTFDIQGPTSTVMTMEQTAINSFGLARDWLLQDRADHVLVVLGDDICAFNAYAMAHLPPSPLLNPKSDECTSQIGEGAVGFVLSRADLVQKKYCEVSDVQLWAETPPATPRTLVASYGGFQQSSRNRQWLGATAKPEQHAPLYGSMVAGLAFEIAIAALKVSEDHLPTACVQITDHGEAQSLVLR